MAGTFFFSTFKNFTNLGFLATARADRLFLDLFLRGIEGFRVWATILVGIAIAVRLSLPMRLAVGTMLALYVVVNAAESGLMVLLGSLGGPGGHGAR